MKKMNNVPHRRVRIMRPRKGLTVAQQLQAPLNQALLNRAYRGTAKPWSLLNFLRQVSLYYYWAFSTNARIWKTWKNAQNYTATFSRPPWEDLSYDSKENYPQQRRVRHLRRINHHLQHVTNIVSHIWDLLCKKGKVDAEITIQEINVKLLPRIKELKEL